MDQVERWLWLVAGAVSRLLDPVSYALLRLEFAIRTQLTAFGMPFQWQANTVTVVWVIVAFMTFRVVVGWVRPVFLVLLLLVCLKMYGYMPAG